jgi:hypothetical protein
VQRPLLGHLKKLKKSISTASTHLTHSCLSTTDSISNNKSINCGNEPSTNSGRSEPEVELTPQEELSMSFNSHLIIYLHQMHSRSIGACPSTPSSNLMSFSRTTMAGPLTFLPVLLPNANYVLVVFIILYSVSYVTNCTLGSYIHSH